MSSSALFPALAAVAAAATLDTARARVFKGTGTGLLPVPGLMEVNEVRVAGVILPRQIMQEFPGDLESKTLVHQARPLWDVAEGQDGKPVLVRSGASNDGIWQKGVEITVVGDWEPEPEKPQADKTGENGDPPGPKK